MLTFSLTIPLALRTNVVAEHGTKDKILLWRKLVQWTGDDKPDSLQTLAPTKIHVQVLLPDGLQQVWYALTLQALYGQFTVLLVAGEQHHMAHALVQLVDVVHQHLHLCGNHRCSHSSQFALQRYGKYINCTIPKNECF